MFKQNKVEKKKIGEINQLIDLQINLSSWRTSDYYLSLSLQRLSWDSLRTKNVSFTHAENILKGKQIMATEKIRQKSHRVYPPEIMQTSLVVRLQKKSLEHNDCLQVAQIATESQNFTNGQYP